MKMIAIKKQQGLTLVELMIAMVIGVILALGLLSLLVNVTQSYRVQNAIKTLNENGQFAIEYLSRDIKDAGFWGCTSSTNDLTNNLSTSTTGFNAVFHDFTHAVEGTQSSLSGGRDILIIRGVDNIQQSMHVQIPYPATYTDPIAITPGSTINTGDIILVGDCEQGDIFQVTNTDPGISGSLSHVTGVQSPGNTSDTLSKVYGADAYVFTPYTHIYDIQTGSNGEPALFRTTIDGTQELVDNVEAMVIYYGEDLTGNGTANRYVRADGVANMLNVVSVRIELLLASEDDELNTSPQGYYFNKATVTPTDKKIRRVYTRTVVIKNRTG